MSEDATDVINVTYAIQLLNQAAQKLDKVSHPVCAKIAEAAEQLAFDLKRLAPIDLEPPENNAPFPTEQDAPPQGMDYCNQDQIF